MQSSSSSRFLLDCKNSDCLELHTCQRYSKCRFQVSNTYIIKQVKIAAILTNARCLFVLFKYARKLLLFVL